MLPEASCWLTHCWPNATQCTILEYISWCGWWCFFSSQTGIRFYSLFGFLKFPKKIESWFFFLLFSCEQARSLCFVTLCDTVGHINALRTQIVFQSTMRLSIIPFIQIFTIIRIVREVNRKAVYIHPKSNTISRWPKKFFRMKWKTNCFDMSFAWSQRVCVCVYHFGVCTNAAHSVQINL